MNIKETCDDWSLDFNSTNEAELSTDEQECLKNILHTTGDSLGIILNIVDEEAELRRKVMEVITSIYLDARARMQIAIEFTIRNQAIVAPLLSGFTDEELFGENLSDTFKATLTEPELDMIKEFLDPPNDEDEDGEKETNNN